MTLTQSVARNFVVQIIGRFLALILGLFVVGLLMRYLGLKNYGYYSTAFAFLQVFGIIADFGLYLITLRYLGEADILEEEKIKKEKKVMDNIFTFRFFSALIFYGGSCVLGLFFPYPPIVKTAIVILAGSLFLCTLIQTLSAFYQKILETEKIFLGEVLGKGVTLFLMILFVKMKLGFYPVLSVFALGYLVNFLILFFVAQKKILLEFSFDFEFWKKIIKDSWPIGLAIIFNVVYFKGNTLVMSFYRSAEEVGLFGGCYRVLEILITVPPLLLGLITPLLAKSWRNKETEYFKNLVQKTFDVLLIIVLPIVFGTFIVGEKIMVLLGGVEFILAGQILKIVIIATGILFVAELFKNLAVSLGKQRQILPFYFLTAVLSLIACFIFIPRYSYWAAAWITVFSEGLMLVFVFCLFWQTTKITPNLKIFFKSFFSGLIMFCVLMFFKDFNLFFLIIFGALIYSGCLYLFKGINKSLLKEIIKIKQ